MDEAQNSGSGRGSSGPIAASLATMSQAPGVYRMLDAQGAALYVGKARNLRRRLVAYTEPTRLPERLRRMVADTVSLEVITTHTEAEALLLEANLIKKLKPRFNILLRDDKSYPWLMLTEDHPFPQLGKHRGAQTRKAGYWGPFASSWSVNQTVQGLQRVFLLRTCTDAVFAHRTRPCLLFQIKRCAAPCVGRISEADYAALVAEARRFLSGRGGHVQRELAAQMEAAAEALEFERAAALRDRIRGLTQIQGGDLVNPASIEDADVIAIHQAAGQFSVQVFFVRGGRNNGNRSFFPAQSKGLTASVVLSAFIAQFYDDKPPPPLILLSERVAEQDLLAEALSLRLSQVQGQGPTSVGRRVELVVPQRGEKHEVVQHALTNAREALERKLAESEGQASLLAATGALFAMAEPPRRIEIYDNSHMMGSAAYGVMVVAGPEGFQRASYRKFAIRSALTPGDDFAMMREVLTRRFTRALSEAAADERGARENWPDLLLIDGGAGQLSAAQAVLDALGVRDVALVAISKGPDRNAGREWLHRSGQAPVQLPERDPVLYFLQRLRDEAHRFAIATHRAQRSRKLTESELDLIAGIGAARKRALLHHFGSVRGVKGAGLRDLEAVDGVSSAMARVIYGHFHPGVTLKPDGRADSLP